MQRVVIVSPQFPPSNLAGAHRARILASNLPEFGWEPVVVCIDESYYEEPLDLSLASLVPESVRVIKVGAARAALARRFGVGDLGLRGYFPLRGAVNDLVRKDEVDLVFITLSPNYPALIGAGLRRRYRVPLVLDFQDPWVSPWGAGLPRWSKGGLSHWLARRLEPRVVRWADHITSVSSGTNALLAGRYPPLSSDRMTAIPIGAAPEDFEAIRDVDVRAARQLLGPGKVHLSYVGTYWPAAEETFRALFAAVANLDHSVSESGPALRLNFVGTSARPGQQSDFPVTALASEYGIEQLVHEVPGRIPYLQALALLRASDGLLVLGSNEPHYSASKTYLTLLSGRPGVALLHESSDASDLILRTGGLVLVTFSNRRPVGSQIEQIEAALGSIVARSGSIPEANLAAMESDLARSVGRRFAGVFDKVLRDHRPGAYW